MTSPRRVRRTLVVVCAAALTIVGGSAGAEKPSPLRECTRVAAPSGSDGAAGTALRPFRTAARLVRALRPGETGCLRAGVYEEDVSIRTGGSRGLPITLRSAPGERATLVGELWVAGTADDVVVRNLRLDGRSTDGVPSPQVNGDRVTFRFNDVTNANTAICFLLGGGGDGHGSAVGTVIDRNRIHHCGRLPRTNHDHGIYVEIARGTRITNNVIYANADWGVHLYPDADGSYVARNVIDGNGSGIIVASESAGEYDRPRSSDGNVIELNVISNSIAGYNLEAWWGGPVGSGNVVRRNCLWAGARGNVGDVDAVSVVANVVANPLYAGRARADYRLSKASACARMGAGPSG